ncbi:hypothetical protein D8B26_006774 [Coccidioides posadasii str. Silveira]|uniref:ThiJ/PfpI family protein n=1 Tax=Coccidioides posadasii (strain RMSCC 757 / Silveira) TaxID=443226 RepID=E9CRJ9_COCPS|nr:ThiJ/PfpI family protein [Coccidioides posadasii str. Silveira]QVM12139.1 hypothetical protein D8B26_006774 [Coccidioides posadasii str. Silveira]
MATSKSNPLRIGVLISGWVQLLDLAVIDLFAIMSPGYIKTCHLPQSIVDLAVPLKIHYIGASSAPANLSANVSINLTDTVSSPSVSPGNLDILMIPGPDPNQVPSDDLKTFVREHHDVGTTILSICTGCIVAAHAGILNGKRATGPRIMIPGLREQFPKVKEWDGSCRFVKDGNVWSSGSIANGFDLAIAYLRENYPAPLVDVVCDLSEVAERPSEYVSGLRSEFFGKL